jgi:hypothetical protein
MAKPAKTGPLAQESFNDLIGEQITDRPVYGSARPLFAERFSRP